MPFKIQVQCILRRKKLSHSKINYFTLKSAKFISKINSNLIFYKIFQRRFLNKNESGSKKLK